eukprot:COSAG02_NODE_2301_length_9188_cov_2.263615_6_plen_181_part_00
MIKTWLLSWGAMAGVLGAMSSVQGWYSAAQTKGLDWSCQAPLVQLMVQLLSGATIMVEVEAEDSVATLKEIVKRREAAIARGLLALPGEEEQRLVAATPWNTPGLASGARVLHDSSTVAECGLRRLATITQLPLEPAPAPAPVPEPEPEPEAKTDEQISAEMFAELDDGDQELSAEELKR